MSHRAQNKCLSQGGGGGGYGGGQGGGGYVGGQQGGYGGGQGYNNYWWEVDRRLRILSSKSEVTEKLRNVK